LSHAARAAGHADLEALAAAVTDDPAAWEALIAEVTIGETYFFRNTAQFIALRELILPSLIDMRRQSAYLRLWSAGCATGEEPYSLAMTLDDVLPEPQRWQVSILATDINRRFLQRAREAVYGAWSFRETPAALRERYFTPEGARWRLNAAIRRQVVFTHLNLAEPTYPAAGNGTLALDLIFCRNVTIYFDEATTRQVAQRFYDALTPGGWLVIGHAEPHLAIYRQFETHNVPGAVLYRKPLRAPVFQGVAPPLPAPIPMQMQKAKGQTRHAAHGVPMSLDTPAVAGYATDTGKRTAPAPLVVEAAAAPPPPSFAERLAAARAAADRGEWGAALEQAEAVAEAHPLEPRGHYLLGQIHEHLGANVAALAAYRRSVYLDPGFVLGLLGMAQIWRRDGHIAEACRALRGAKRQLERRAPTEAPPDAEGAGVGDLLTYVNAQLAALGQAA
jgi:chemotaxis protein methyltransferase CheR